MKRLVSLFLLSLFLLFSVSFGVNAASGNLVNQDLTQWKSFTGDVSVYTPDNHIYRLTAVVPSYDFLYDLPSYVAGHSYTLKFSLPDGDDISAAWGIDYSDDKVINYYTGATINIGYGFLSSDGSSFEEATFLYTFNASNISKYIGKELTTSFVGASASGRPCLFINIECLDGSNTHYFFFQDFILIDNDDDSGELTGIKGFLHSIRWDLVGGVCDDEDCPHSSEGSPHLSLTERMSSGFSSMFNNIASKFEEGSTLNTWFTNLSNGVSTLSSDMDGFIDKLGKLLSGDITGGFGDVGSWFTDLGNDLSSWFDSVKLKFQEVGDSITAKFEEIGDRFTEFFEKFKPRVYIDFEWIRGNIGFHNGVVYVGEDKNNSVLISKFFTVSDSDKYIVDFIRDDTVGAKNLVIFKYSLDGTYLNEYQSFSYTTEDIVLEPGYNYRFRLMLNPEIDNNVANVHVLVYADEGWINALLYNFKTGIKNLFVPDEFYLINFKDEVSKIFEDSLGFVYTFIDYVVQLFDKLQVIFKSVKSDEVFTFTFPKFEFDFLGYHIKLWDDITISMDWLTGTTGIGLLYNVYKGMLHFMFILALVNYGDKVYKDVTASQ